MSVCSWQIFPRFLFVLIRSLVQMNWPPQPETELSSFSCLSDGSSVKVPTVCLLSALKYLTQHSPDKLCSFLIPFPLSYATIHLGFQPGTLIIFASVPSPISQCPLVTESLVLCLLPSPSVSPSFRPLLCLLWDVWSLCVPIVVPLLYLQQCYKSENEFCHRFFCLYFLGWLPIS